MLHIFPSLIFPPVCFLEIKSAIAPHFIIPEGYDAAVPRWSTFQRSFLWDYTPKVQMHNLASAFSHAALLKEIKTFTLQAITFL